MISSILFNIQVKDLFEKIVSQRCKFADDRTMWKSGDNLVEVSECIQKDINEIMEWSRKWRININAEKIEYCIFYRLKQHPGHTILKLNNKILKYNNNPKLWGVTLDEKLNFGQHIQNIERKAGNSLGMLIEIKGLGQIKKIFALQIYNSLIGSVLQYASCVWQIGNKDNLDKLNTVQRK